MIRKGDVWVNPKNGEWLEHLADAREGDPVRVENVLLNGEHPEEGTEIPRWLFHEHHSGLAVLKPEPPAGIILLRRREACDE